MIFFCDSEFAESGVAPPPPHVETFVNLELFSITSSLTAKFVSRTMEVLSLTVLCLSIGGRFIVQTDQQALLLQTKDSTFRPNIAAASLREETEYADETMDSSVVGNDYFDLPNPTKLDCGNGGVDPEKDLCVFPWHWTRTNKTYTGCTADESSEYWCSTKVDADGNHLSGNWAECSKECVKELNGEYVDPVGEGCFTTSGEECSFPITIAGFTYHGGCLEGEGFENGWCQVLNPENPKFFKKAECASDCPKDHLLTSEDLSIEEILQTLMETPTVVTTISRNDDSSCKDLMQRKFEARKVEDLPEPARAAESWSEAFELVCKGAAYCAESTFVGCGDLQLDKRITAKADKKAENADCRMDCGFPV